MASTTCVLATNGDGLFPKTLVVLRTQADSDDVFNRLQRLHAKATGEEPSNTSTFLRMINEVTDAATRAALIEEWKKPDASIRILVSSSDDDEELMVPGIENVVLFEKEGQLKSYMRQQRMARMCGQTGVYVTIVPPTKLLVEHYRDEKPNERDGIWRPAAWSDAKRQWEIERVSRGLDAKRTLNYVCHLLMTGQAYFEEDDVRFKA
ncbi:hypothetical protein AC578_677 [Pseudocercospora eumusae]|uniref:Uncharacterized protein n=1 Tax=Pseudocercospora eumusae TaxID=321146 RepID=A0A139HKT4_9PEZI|nr:hypothetical protein AC578_677 [Pseudocercospora eumusae]